jgi:serine/threonine protein kinase
MSLPSAKKRKIFDGRYEVISIVGRGLDSVVYHARHLSGAQQEVALKVLVNNKPKSSMTERLRKEALTLVSCRHKYVVRLDDFHSVAELCYLSMEYAAFGDLRKYITARGAPLSPELGAEFLRQALEAMEFIHATGVLHRDVKPDNILVITENEIRLADFGLALLPGDELDLEELQNGVGSLSYLPPEMLQGQFYDSRSDLYSLGVCFYEAMAGFHPFENAPLSEQESARLDRNIKPLHEVNPHIPAHVSAVVASLMRHSVDQRFQTAMEALRALSDTAFEGTSSATTESTDPGDEAELTSTDDVASRTSIASTPPTYTPVNVDEPIDSYTDDFDDFFKDTEYSSAAKPGISGDASLEPKAEDTQEMSAQRVQQLIEQDSKKRATAAFRNSFGETPAASAQDDSPPSWSVGTKPAHSPHANLSGDEELPGITIKNQGVLSTLLTMHPIIRTLLVGAVAALITIGLVVASHVKPAAILASVTSSTESTEGLPEETEATTGDTLFPNLPAGTFAGTIYGILPGVTSPLALISRPEHNEITVVIGVEGWTPTTVSTKLGENSSSTIVIRSNSVLLNMTGSGSPSEVEGTFTNAITGETGVWSVKKLS